MVTGYNISMKSNSRTFDFLRIAAIAGNGIFVLWILFNGMDEGFKANLIQIVSYLSLILLMILNTFLLICSQRNP
jgi:hypothetical protein